MPEITRRLDRAELGKRVERAEKLLQKGKTAEALEEYLQVLRDDHENDVVRQLSADLCLSVNRNADAVKLLIEIFGAERVALGSDYPFPLGEAEPGQLIESLNLSAKEKQQLLSETAREFLGL